MQDLISSLDIKDSGPQDIGWIGVLIALVAVILAILLSFLFSLKLEAQFSSASLRAILQISTLALILQPLFQSNYIQFVLLFASLMILVASYETSARTLLFYDGIMRDCFIAILTATFLMGAFSFSLILNLSPFWDARYFIPLTGMLLGNAINCATVSLSMFLESIKNSNATILFKVSKGANFWESIDDYFIKSARIGLVPVINQLSIVGLISIPGMMTGQILGGTDPMVAARYQLMILFLITGTCALSTVILLFLASKRIFSSKHGLCLDLIKQRSSSGGVNKFIEYYLSLFGLKSFRP